MKHAGWVVPNAATFCALAAILWWRFAIERAPSPGGGELTHALPATVERGDSRAEARAIEPPQLPGAQPVKLPDYAAQLREASDYLVFVRSLLGAARAGDHAAQFYIFRALDYCTVDYRFYVDRGRVRRTLDDALKWAAMHWPYETETVRLVYARCNTLVESDTKDLGARAEWLRLASDGGYPLAQVAAANELRIEARGTGDDAARRKESQRLLSTAIRSRDAAVIWEIGNSPARMPDEEREPIGGETAWFLAACERGFDCSPRSDATRALCRFDMNCQPYEAVTDIFRRAMGNEFPEMEARARWINEKIDAGDWEALGF